MDIEELKQKAKEIRKDIIEAVYSAKSGHPGGSLSIADILAVLYFKELRIDEKNPKWEDRDRLVYPKDIALQLCMQHLLKEDFLKKIN